MEKQAGSRRRHKHGGLAADLLVDLKVPADERAVGARFHATANSLSRASTIAPAVASQADQKPRHSSEIQSAGPEKAMPLSTWVREAEGAILIE